MRRPVLLVLTLILLIFAGAVMVDRWQHRPPALDKPVAASGLVKESSERRHSPASAGDVLGAAGPRAQVRIREIGPGRYEVRGAAVQALLDNTGGGLSDLALTVMPLPSFQTGMQFLITSVMGDGVLAGFGFIVGDSTLAAAAGIHAGDIVVKIDGAHVGGFLASLLTMRRDPDRRTIEVELDRRGMKLIQTYEIR